MRLEREAEAKAKIGTSIANPHRGANTDTICALLGCQYYITLASGTPSG